MTVTVERLLHALWKEDALMRETLSLLSVERIALPWRRTDKMGFVWSMERRSIFGSLVAECYMPVVSVKPGLKTHTPVAEARYRIVAKSAGFPMTEEGRGPDEAAVRALTDAALNKRGWLVVDLPRLGPWEPLGAGGWARKTSLGDVAAWVKPSPVERRFKTYVMLDEQEADFEGTPDKAMSVVDRNLEHLGFVLG